MRDIQLLIGKDLPGNMPLRYKNIITIVDMLYEKKIITNSDLNEFKEQCDNFFSKYNDDMLNSNNDLFNLFLDTTGYNNITKKFIPEDNYKIINTNKINTNLFYFYTKKKKHKDGLRIIEGMLFDSNIIIEDFIKKVYAIYAAEPYVQNKIRIFDSNYMCIAEIDEQGSFNYKIDTNKLLKDFITNFKFDESNMDINYAIDTAKRIAEIEDIDDIIDMIRPEACQFTIISREFLDLKHIEKERIDAFWYS